VQLRRWLLLLLSGGLLGGPSLARADNGPDATPDLEKLSLESLMKVEVVSPTRKPERVAQAPAIVYVIRGEQLRKSGAVSLAEALDRLPGIAMVRLPNGTQQAVVRGALSSDGVLVLIDGVPVNDDLDGGFNFYGLDLADVERVEVITGPGSAVYGGRALMALVQIFTIPRLAEDAPDRSYGVGVGGGTLGTRRARLFFRQKLGEARFHVSGAYIASNGSAVPINSDFATLERARLSFVSPSLAPARRDEPTEVGYATTGFTFRGLEATTLFAARRMRPRLTYFSTLPPQDAYERLDQLVMAQARYVLRAGSLLTLTPRVFFSLNHVHTGGTLTGPVTFASDTDLDGVNETWPGGWREQRRHGAWVMGAELESVFTPVKWNTATFGVAFEDRRLRSVLVSSNVLRSRQQVGDSALPEPQVQTGDRFVVPTLSRQIISLYAQDVQQISRYASLTGGVRWDRYSDFGSTLTPRGGLWFGPIDRLDVKLLYGRAFKPPTFQSIGDLTPTDRNPDRVFGNPSLRPTKVATWEASVSYRIGVMALTGSAFHASTSDEVVFDGTSQRFINGAARTIRGTSIEARYVPSAMQFASANYTYQLVSGVATGFLAPIYPRHRLNLEAGWGIERSIEVRAGLRLRGAAEREPGDQRSPIPTAAMVDLTVAFPELLRGVRFESRFLNVMNTRVRDPAPVETGVSDFLHDGFGVLFLAEATP
jgi:outer membrane cobalamin receptor